MENKFYEISKKEFREILLENLKLFLEDLSKTSDKRKSFVIKVLNNFNKEDFFDNYFKNCDRFLKIYKEGGNEFLKELQICAVYKDSGIDLFAEEKVNKKISFNFSMERDEVSFISISSVDYKNLVELEFVIVGDDLRIVTFYEIDEKFGVQFIANYDDFTKWIQGSLNGNSFILHSDMKNLVPDQQSDQDIFLVDKKGEFKKFSDLKIPDYGRRRRHELSIYKVKNEDVEYMYMAVGEDSMYDYQLSAEVSNLITMGKKVMGNVSEVPLHAITFLNLSEIEDEDLRHHILLSEKEGVIDKLYPYMTKEGKLPVSVRDVYEEEEGFLFNLLSEDNLNNIEGYRPSYSFKKSLDNFYWERNQLQEN